MRTKILFSTLISLLLLISINFMGCLEDPVDEDSVVIELTTFTTMTPGATKQIQGTIEASPAIDENDITIGITKAGNTVTSNFSITKNDIEKKEKINLETDLALKITPSSSIDGGTYVLTIGATAGSASSSKNVTFTITGTTPDLVSVDVTLGSWQNTTVGQSLDADVMLVYSKTEAAAISANIDIWYSNDAEGRNVLYSPLAAGNAQHPPKDWATKNETMMAKVTGVNFDAITKQAQVDSLWALVSATDKKNFHYAAANDVVVLLTDLNNTRIMKFLSGDGTGTGTAVMKGKK